jgi:hypothetical protein
MHFRRKPICARESCPNDSIALPLSYRPPLHEDNSGNNNKANFKLHSRIYNIYLLRDNTLLEQPKAKFRSWDLNSPFFVVAHHGNDTLVSQVSVSCGITRLQAQSTPPFWPGRSRRSCGSSRKDPLLPDPLGVQQGGLGA